jgi:hypothetical protein
VLFRGWTRWSAGGLVVTAWVDGELAQQFAGGGVDDANVEVLDEEQDVGSGVGSADAEVVQPAGQAQGDAAGFVDLVGADPVVGVGAAVGAGGGFGAGGVGGGRGGPLRQRAVRAVLVVGGDEEVDEGLQVGDRGRLEWLGGQPLLQGLLEAFDLAAGGRVVRGGSSSV